MESKMQIQKEYLDLMTKEILIIQTFGKKMISKLKKKLRACSQK
jgi:hypothetical protein